VLWLLPLLAARALLPVGFMLAADAHGLALAFCPTQSRALAAAFPLASDAAQHGGEHQHHHAPAEADDPGATADSPCPYALGAEPISESPAARAGLSRPLEHEPRPLTARADPRSGPLRAEEVRGPPVYS
jgi:hypothetical protein